MKSLFEFEEYRGFIKYRFSHSPKKGHGQPKRLADHLGIHTTLVSQILLGKKSFTQDQAALAAEFLNLSELETEYFVSLVNWDRAGNNANKKLIRRQMDQIRKKSDELANRVQVAKALSEEERAIFYSNWMYSAVRQMTAFPEVNSIEKIAEQLQLPRSRVIAVIEFLLKCGLVGGTDGEYFVGPASTHIPASSPLSRVHHRNWRERSLPAMDQDLAENVFFSTPMTLSRKDSDVVRKMIVQFMEEIYKVVDPSPSQTLRCLNIDWFKVV